MSSDVTTSAFTGAMRFKVTAWIAKTRSGR